MSVARITKTLKIDGMTCSSCENRIENKLQSLNGIIEAKVSYSDRLAKVTYDENVIKLEDIIENIDGLDYKAAEISKSSGGGTSITKIVGVGVIIFALYFIISRLGGFTLFNSFPLAKEGMSYGMLFVIGLLTSVHCIAMCGGINISQSVGKASSEPANSVKLSALRPPFLYNAGRVISYTIIGGIVGAIGSVVSFSGYANGIVQLAAGVFMIIMGLSMMNILPSLSRLVPRLPKSLASRISRGQSGRSPFIIGLLNGLMPCGPLQAMQLYALSTGSIIGGALSMFIFSLGTVPLMFGLGAVSSLLNRKFAGKLITASAVLVVLLGVFMLGNGLSLSGVSAPVVAADRPIGKVAQIVDGIQIVTVKLSSNSYEPIVVQKGIPVRWIIQADRASINGCNNRIIIPSLKKEKSLVPGDNVIDFTPTASGIVPFSCWMGMIKSRITVVDDISFGTPVVQNNEADEGPAAAGNDGQLSVPSCCL